MDGNPNSEEPDEKFDAEWEQFEAELQGAPAKDAPVTESSTVSYPHSQSSNPTQADVYATSFQYTQPRSDDSDHSNDKASSDALDDSAAYSPSSEPILDLFLDDKSSEMKKTNEERSTEKSDAGSQKNEPGDKDHKRKDEKPSRHSRHRSHSRSHSRSRSRDRSHKSKRHHSRHRHSRDRDRHHKRHRSNSSSSSSSRSRSRSRSSEDYRHRSHRSPDRRRRDDDRGRHSDNRRHHDDRPSLSAATVGNYGPRSAEQIEKQRQLNAAVLNQKQTTKRVGKNKTYIPNRNRSSDSGQDAPVNADEGSARQQPVRNPFQKKKPFDSKMTPQERAAVLQKQVEDATGIQMPKYYNPAAINPLKYAEQMQKRKLLWSKAKEGKTDNESLWQNTALALDTSSSNKFQKLMGLKSGEEPTTAESKQASVSVQVANSRRKQDQLFDNLDREYEFARMSTHTHRGMGLGFQSAAVEKAALIASVNSSNAATSSTTKK